MLATPRTRRPGTGTTLRPVPSWLERVVSSTQRTAVSTAFDRGSGLLNFTPKDQIILLAGLEADVARRVRIWSRPELSARLARLADAGLVDPTGLSEPAGVAAARRLRHITLDDLLAEHLPPEA